MKKYDLVILTQDIYVDPQEKDALTQNVLLEDQLVEEALQQKGLTTCRVNWDNTDFDWASAKALLFRATWDYFHRFKEFDAWLNKVKEVTELINPYEQIMWNIDKHYLTDLEQKGINIVPTLFIEPRETRTLQEVITASGWKNVILKPAISGGARHTYKLNEQNIAEHEAIFSQLIAEESMLLQPFLDNIIPKGEVSYMTFGGKFSHAILKIAKPGDFRVQDDFGGSVHAYAPNAEEIAFAEKCAAQCTPIPVYARVDVVWDNNNELALAEMEMIEPELWFRMDKNSAHLLADVILTHIESQPK